MALCAFWDPEALALPQEDRTAGREVPVPLPRHSPGRGGPLRRGQPRAAPEISKAREACLMLLRTTP